MQNEFPPELTWFILLEINNDIDINPQIHYYKYMIEQVPAFKTSDGRIFSDKVTAIKHEYALEIRGVFPNSLVE